MAAGRAIPQLPNVPAPKNERGLEKRRKELAALQGEKRKSQTRVF
jgi:hypothetical protein